MVRSISKQIKALKSSTYKSNGKPPPGDKLLGIEPDICLYEREDGDKTE